MRHAAPLAVLALVAVASPAAQPAPALRAAIADPGRSAADRARDGDRHPAETLGFFGIRPDMTVVELIPGGGWYTAILAPYLASEGRLIEAVPPGKAAEAFSKRIAADPARYGQVSVVPFTPGRGAIAPAGSADMVLTFRNIHNLLGDPATPGDGQAPAAFADWYRALKPGGVLGIEEHRLPETMDAAREKTTGYVKRSTVVRLATAAGFRLAASSDVNANARDTHNWPQGVWTLPPTLTLGSQDRAKYQAIGESDRMTLRFVKPGGKAAAGSRASSGH